MRAPISLQQSNAIRPVRGLRKIFSNSRQLEEQLSRYLGLVSSDDLVTEVPTNPLFVSKPNSGRLPLSTVEESDPYAIIRKSEIVMTLAGALNTDQVFAVVASNTFDMDEPSHRDALFAKLNAYPQVFGDCVNDLLAPRDEFQASIRESRSPQAADIVLEGIRKLREAVLNNRVVRSEFDTQCPRLFSYLNDYALIALGESASGGIVSPLHQSGDQHETVFAVFDRAGQARIKREVAARRSGWNWWRSSDSALQLFVREFLESDAPHDQLICRALAKSPYWEAVKRYYNANPWHWPTTYRMSEHEVRRNKLKTISPFFSRKRELLEPGVEEKTVDSATQVMLQANLQDTAILLSATTAGHAVLAYEITAPGESRELTALREVFHSDRAISELLTPPDRRHETPPRSSGNFPLEVTEGEFGEEETGAVDFFGNYSDLDHLAPRTPERRPDAPVPEGTPSTHVTSATQGSADTFPSQFGCDTPTKSEQSSAASYSQGGTSSAQGSPASFFTSSTQGRSAQGDLRGAEGSYQSSAASYSGSGSEGAWSEEDLEGFSEGEGDPPASPGSYRSSQSGASGNDYTSFFNTGDFEAGGENPPVKALTF